MQTVSHNMRAEEIRALVGSSPVMLEIGSHEGADTIRFLRAMPGIRLFCFEPERRAVARFRRLIGDDPRLTLYDKAVGDVDGDKLFYASTGKAGGREDWDFSGSLRRPTGHLGHSPEIKFKPPVRVPCVQLDTWLSRTPGIGRIDFIWADVQGAQRDVIAGGQLALGIARYLYIECHRRPLYEGEPTRRELIAMLPNFEPLKLYARDNLLFQNRNVT